MRYKLKNIIKKIIKEELLLESKFLAGLDLLEKLTKVIPIINDNTSDNEYITMLKTELDKGFVYNVSEKKYEGNYKDPKSGNDIPYIHGNTINKPIGLWFGKNTSWLEHCIDNIMTNFVGDYIYKIDINKNNLLNISKSNIKEINEYIVPVTDYGDYKVVDWGKIMNNYAGAYFENNLNDKFMFDRGIDVYHTGCIWDLKKGISRFHKWDFKSKSWEQI